MNEADLLKQLSASVLMFDRRLKLLFLNPAAEDLLGNSARRCLGCSVDELFGDNGAALTRRSQEALGSGVACTEHALKLHLEPGCETVVDCAVTPLDESRGVVMEMVRLDRQLQIRREEDWLNRQQALRAMWREIAHEVKNPLSGIRGAAQLLDRELPDDDLREYTRVIISEVDRLRDLVDGLLGPNKPPRLGQINLHEALERVYLLLQAEAPAAVRLERDYDPSIPPLHADKNLLVQAFMNIARNALQAVGDSGCITIKSRVERQFVINSKRHPLVARAAIADDGAGINDDIAERMFYPLVSDREHGSGLGLPIAQSAVSRHGGLIEWDSQPGRTEFSVILPIAGPVAGPIAGPVEESVKGAAAESVKETAKGSAAASAAARAKGPAAAPVEAPAAPAAG